MPIKPDTFGTNNTVTMLGQAVSKFTHTQAGIINHIMTLSWFTVIMRYIPISDKVKCENKNKNTTYITESIKYGFSSM